MGLIIPNLNNGYTEFGGGYFRDSGGNVNKIGGMYYSNGKGNTYKIFSSYTGKNYKVGTPISGFTNLWSLACAPDGTLLAGTNAGYDNGSSRVFRILPNSTSPVSNFLGGAHAFEAITWDEHTQCFYAGTADPGINCYDKDLNFKWYRSLSGYGNVVYDVTCIPDLSSNLSIIVVGTDSGNVVIISSDNSSIDSTSVSQEIDTLAYNQNNLGTPIIGIGSPDGLHLWYSNSGSPQTSNFSKSISAMSYNPKNNLFYIGGDKASYVYSVTTDGDTTKQTITTDSNISAMCIDKDGMVYVGLDNGEVQKINYKDGSIIWTVSLGNIGVNYIQHICIDDSYNLYAVGPNNSVINKILQS